DRLDPVLVLPQPPDLPHRPPLPAARRPAAAGRGPSASRAAADGSPARTVRGRGVAGLLRRAVRLPRRARDALRGRRRGVARRPRRRRDPRRRPPDPGGHPPAGPRAQLLGRAVRAVAPPARRLRAAPLGPGGLVRPLPAVAGAGLAAGAGGPRRHPGDALVPL